MLAALSIGTAWLAIGYVAGKRRINRATRAQLNVMNSHPRGIIVASFAISALLWPIMGELA